jgi:branched-chain amino acid transport system ATP-binding protein
MTPALLDVEALTVRFGGLLAVDSVSFSVPAGQIRGVIGPNGAGKTTLFNTISGLVHQDGGRIRFAGDDITRLPAHRRAALGMRRTFQAVQLIPQFTVLENVLVGLHAGIRGATFSEAAAQRAVIEVLEFLGIGATILRPVAELSFAEQRLTEIARAIVARPRLLMLDEPAAGLSPAELAALDALLRRFVAEWDMTILLVEHVLALVFEVSDTVTVLDNGRYVTEGPPREVAGDPRVKAVYLGEDTHA